jgi:hypothetical protein
MPPRLVSVAILVYWSLAALGLITRDLLPELSLRQPPDLRTITRAEVDAVPARWAVQVVDDPSMPENRRTVGQAVTEAVRRPDGWVVMSSRVWFDASGLLKGTAFANKVSDVRLEVDSTYLVDVSGNLQSLRALVRSQGERGDLLKVEGRLKNRAIEITTHGPLPMMNRTRTIAYEPRGVVQNTLGPVDRLPGLQVGQRWDLRVISPFTGQADVVRVEVTRKRVIHWDKNPVTTLEVVQHMAPLTAKTWVRPDGLVLRQEVPFPFVKLVLDRDPEYGNEASEGPTR